MDDIDLEPISSHMSNEPDLDDEFALSTTQKTSYEYFPETKVTLCETKDLASFSHVSCKERE